MRGAGIKSGGIGVITIVCELVLFLLPFSILVRLVGGFTGSCILSQTISTMCTGAGASPNHPRMRTDPSMRMRAPMDPHAHSRAPACAPP